MFKRFKNYILHKFLLYFICDFKRYLRSMEFQFSDYDNCPYDFDSLEEFLSYTDKYLREISITRSWVDSYEIFFKNENFYS